MGKRDNFYDPRPAMYHELIYRTTSERTTVCLVRNSDNGVAFISTLQATYMPGDIYTLMQNKTALYLQSRINFGANKTVDTHFMSEVYHVVGYYSTSMPLSLTK